MAWVIEWEDKAVKELKALDHEAQRRIIKFLKEKIATDENPRRIGGPLKKELKGFWKYRVGDYRIVCTIEDENIVVLVVRVGHRRVVYR